MDTTVADDSTARPPGYSHDILWIFDADGVNQAFAYTVGLAVRPGRAYELACTTLPAELARDVLNNAAAQLVADNADPAEGLELSEVLEGLPVRLRRVRESGEFKGMRARSGEQPPVWQVLFPDRRGRFPGHPRYDETLPQRLL
ncbi:DUF4262 domain-containing protein [Streptomyces sp. MBT27]|uniref:DUF4262 domain-containing protein n=1 Tax=Streptomyces sp. MBT27 TaxID=1488356 RepID=UPI0014207F50|nr:DUF4262 domain-containing protein [Streptomyces sp. MBT27]